MADSLRTSLHAGGLIIAVGVIAWATGLPALFPSLGPTAYVLALGVEGRTDARRVVGGHAIGVVAGLLAYHVLAAGLMATGPHDPLSAAGIRLAVSGTVSVGLTTAGMLATDLRHAPACATTLIVSLGFLSTLFEAATIIVAVVVLVVTEQLLLAVDRRLGRGI